MSKSRGKDIFTFHDFELGKEIGRGGFGVVYAAKCINGPLKGKDVAIKKVSSTQRKDLLRLEVENHQNIDHENIVKFYGCFNEKGEDYIVMELCKEGSIRQFIREREEPLSVEEAVNVMRQVVSALQYIHKKSLCHRDLTSGNVLIHRIRQNGCILIKVCDFGLSKVMNAKKAHQTVAGTPGYMDPHVANRDKYGKEVDLYALGALLYTMLSGREPGQAQDEKSRFRDLYDLPPEAIDLIKQLTDPDRELRIRLEDITLSPFMKSSGNASSVYSRQSENRPPERRSLIESQSIRERSKSRGPLREMNHSPPNVSRPIGRSRSTSQVRVSQPEKKKSYWPLNFERLIGKKEEEEGYQLQIMSKCEAVLTKNENGRTSELLMEIRVNGTRQKVGVHDKRAGKILEWITSEEDLTASHRHCYNIVIRLLEAIRWKVAKIIFNNSSICEGGTIRYMENGDIRVKDNQGKVYSIRANSNEVYEGNPKNPTSIVKDYQKKNEIRNYRDFCKRHEDNMIASDQPFPFISYCITDDTKTAERKTREAMGESSRMSSSRQGGRSGVCREQPSVQRESRAQSTRSHVKKPSTDAPFTNCSAPAGSMQQSGRTNFSITKNKNGQVVGIKDKIEGTALRVSTGTPNQYIYTHSNGTEERFTFTGNFSSLTDKQAHLMKKLNERR